MNIFLRLSTFISTVAISVSAFTTMSSVTNAQQVPTAPQQKTTQKICAFDAVDNLLPPIESQSGNSPLSYLAKQGFTQNPDGSWVCYVSDSRKQGRYYSLFKVQQIDGRLIATSFLDQGNLMEGQDNRSLDLFMALVEQHIKGSQGNRESIQKFLSAFISLVKQSKIQPSNRGYLFDQPSRAFVVFHSVGGEKLKGTAITINIFSPENIPSSKVSLAGS